SYERVIMAATSALDRLKLQGGDGAAAAPLHHHEALRRPLAIDRLAGRVQELTSLTRWLDESFSGQPRVVLLLGETGTGTAMLMRQLEAEVRIRGGTFAMAASPNLDVPQPYGVWSALLRATNRTPINPPRDWQELHHLDSTFIRPSDPSAPTGSQYRLLSELA